MLRCAQVERFQGGQLRDSVVSIYRADSAFSHCHPQPPGTGLRLVSSWFQVDYRNTQLVRDGKEMTLSLVSSCQKIFPPSHHPKPIPKSVIGKREKLLHRFSLTETLRPGTGLGFPSNTRLSISEQNQSALCQQEGGQNSSFGKYTVVSATRHYEVSWLFSG